MHNYISFWLLFLSFLAAFLYHSKESNNVFIQKQSFPLNQNVILGPARVLLLTAHPDDECLFFAPTILSLITHKAKEPIQITQHSGALFEEGVETEAKIVNILAPEVYLLCLSIGDADGLGKTRKAELERSLDVLGIEEGKRWVVDHPNLNDDITSPWDVVTIANVLKPYVIGHNITTILTFDHRGVSGHPNHRSLPDGVRHLIGSLPASSTLPRPRLFTLITVPLLTKYTSILAPFLAKFDLHCGDMLHLLDRQLARVLRLLGLHVPIEADALDDVLPVFVSGTKEYLWALRAMQSHRSQLVWFRWLYVAFSRYMWVNEWVEVKMKWTTL